MDETVGATTDGSADGAAGGIADVTPGGGSGGGGTGFAIRVDPAFRPLFSVMGAPPSRDVVFVSTGEIQVRLSWLFRSTIPRSAVVAVRHHPDMVGGWGAHGWRGRWLVNGSSKGIVELELAPTQRGWVTGFPVKLRTLWLSLEDPDGFLALLDPPAR